MCFVWVYRPFPFFTRLVKKYTAPIRLNNVFKEYTLKEYLSPFFPVKVAVPSFAICSSPNDLIVI